MKEAIHTPKDLARILVRFAGVYFAYLAVKEIAISPYWIYFVWSLNSEANLWDVASVFTVVLRLMSFALYVAISYYCLRKGKWLIEFITQPNCRKVSEVESGQPDNPLGNSEDH